MGESSGRDSQGRISPDCSAPGAAGVGGKRPLPQLVSFSALPSAAASQSVSCALACASSAAAAPSRIVWEWDGAHYIGGARGWWGHRRSDRGRAGGEWVPELMLGQ